MKKGSYKETRSRDWGALIVWRSDLAIYLNNRVKDTDSMRSQPQQSNFIMCQLRCQPGVVGGTKHGPTGVKS